MAKEDDLDNIDSNDDFDIDTTTSDDASKDETPKEKEKEDDSLKDDIDDLLDDDDNLTKEERDQLKKLTNDFIVDLGVSAKVMKKVLPKLKEYMTKNRAMQIDYVKFWAESISTVQEELNPHLDKIYEVNATREFAKLKSLIAAGFTRDEAMRLLLDGFGSGGLGMPNIPLQVTRVPHKD